MKKLLVALGVLALLTPLGLLAVGEAWGEWAPEDVAGLVGFVPKGLESLAEVWRWAPLPDYSFGPLPEPLGYILSGVVGALVVGGLTALLAWKTR